MTFALESEGSHSQLVLLGRIFAKAISSNDLHQ